MVFQKKENRNRKRVMKISIKIERISVKIQDIHSLNNRNQTSKDCQKILKKVSKYLKLKIKLKTKVKYTSKEINDTTFR